MQKSNYLLNSINQAFISHFIYFFVKGFNLTVSLPVSDILGMQLKRKHGGPYFLVVSYKGQVENWSWDNICHQFALHFHLAWLLSIFLDSFRCYSIDGIYWSQTAQWASLGSSSKVQTCVYLFIYLFVWFFLSDQWSCFELQEHTCIAKYDWPWKVRKRQVLVLRVWKYLTVIWKTEFVRGLFKRLQTTEMASTIRPGSVVAVGWPFIFTIFYFK